VTWTYRIGTDIGKIRLQLGDDTESSGVRPDGANFTDEELQTYLDREGSVMRAVAGLCETLALQYARMADLRVGPRSESLSQIGASFAKRAALLREMYGGIAAAYSVGVTRVDGYSDDVTSDDVDRSSEYGQDFEYVRPEV
jgi:hypothetical protein